MDGTHSANGWYALYQWRVRTLSMEGTHSGQGDPLTGLNKKEEFSMNNNLMYLIDTRTRFCEIGAWSVSQTNSGDLVLRRVLSLGSLWDLKEKGKIKFNGLVAVTDECYKAISSEGFTSGGGRSWRQKNVAAIIESGGRTRVKAFRIHIFPEGTELSFPAKQPVQLNQAVRQAADLALLLRQHIAVGEWFIMEGQSNTFRYAQLNWKTPADNDPLEFPVEHKESLAALHVGRNKDGVLWSFRPEAEE